MENLDVNITWLLVLLKEVRLASLLKSLQVPVSTVYKHPDSYLDGEIMVLNGGEPV